jgi:hypothetical protein
MKTTKVILTIAVSVKWIVRGTRIVACFTESETVSGREIGLAEWF